MAVGGSSDVEMANSTHNEVAEEFVAAEATHRVKKARKQKPQQSTSDILREVHLTFNWM